MSSDNKNTVSGAGNRITMYEGYPAGEQDGAYHFQGAEMLLDRIVAELKRRGYTSEEIDGFWAYGHDGALEQQGVYTTNVVDGLQIAPMVVLQGDVREGGWCVFDEAWNGYEYSTQERVVPTVTICRAGAFEPVEENYDQYTLQEGYRSCEAVVLEIELKTLFDQQ